MADLEKGSGSISVISHTGQNVLNLNLTNDFKFGYYTLGLGLNLVIPEYKRPPGLNLIEFRFIEYDNKTFGVRYGLLSGVTMGYGLLVDDYNSAPGIAYFDQSRAGLKAYTVAFKPVGIHGMLTNSRIIAARMTYDVAMVPGLNKPLVVGGTFVSDSDGVTSGNITYNNGVSGYSFDVAVNLIESLLDSFLEYGALSNNSSGTALGFRFNVMESLKVKAEYRMFGQNFVPGIFNSTYEAAPVDLNNYVRGPINGYFVGFEYNAAPLGILSVGYTDYDNAEAVFKAGIAFRKIMGYSGQLTYQKLVFSTLPYLLRGSVEYPINMFSSAVINMEKIGDEEPSYSVAYKVTF